MFKRKLKKNLDKSIEKLNDNIEKSNLHELSYVLGSKWEIIKRNLLAGIFRGIGIGIGVTLITAIIIIILRKILLLNIPVIGEYIGDIVDIIEKSK